MIILLYILLIIIGCTIAIILFAAQVGFSAIETLSDRPILKIITILLAIGVIAFCLWALTECFNSLTSLKYFKLI